LILDEPTAGVDIEIRRSMWKFLAEINARGTTIILTTHYLEEAEQLCRHIAIINHGEKVEHTEMKSLLLKLQIETFVLDLRESIDSAPEVEGYNLRMLDTTTISVDISKEQSLNQLFEALSAQGLHVLSMRNKTNRLEELFVRMMEEGRS
jgi:ABC-2 type transport system ATP-binding protein